jgi:biotin synthase-related radical SAM superfamily protein
MAYKDLRKRKEYHKKYYMDRMANDPEYVAKKRASSKKYKKKHIAKHTLRNIAIIAEFKKDGCYICDEKDIICLCCHHKDPSKKLFNIADAIHHAVSVKRLTTELEKCICLCMNCHTKLHHIIRKEGMLSSIP